MRRAAPAALNDDRRAFGFVRFGPLPAILCHRRRGGMKASVLRRLRLFHPTSSSTLSGYTPSLSFRDIEELLAERGIDVSHDTIAFHTAKTLSRKTTR